MKRTFRLTKTGLNKINQKIKEKFSHQKGIVTKISNETRLDRATVSRIFPHNKPVTERILENFFAGLDIGTPQEGRDYEEYYEQTDANLESSPQDTVLSKSKKTIQIEESMADTDPFYIQRYEKNSNEPLDIKCLSILRKSGACLRVKAPDGMGKRTLIEKVREQLDEDQNYYIVDLDLQEISNTKTLKNIESFLKTFCICVNRRLNSQNGLDIEEKVILSWDETVPDTFNSTNYFEEHLLSQLSKPLILILFSFDSVFHSDIAEDFFKLLRAWNQKHTRKNSIWIKFRLILSYNTEMYAKSGIEGSPLENVGEWIELPEFSRKQVYDLVNHYHEKYQLFWNAQDIDKWVDELINIVGGHPGLLRQSLNYISTHSKITVEEFKKNASRGQQPFISHLLKYWNLLDETPNLKKAFHCIIMRDRSRQLSPPEQFQLYGMGLIHWPNHIGEIIPRCQLYQDYFEEKFKYLEEIDND